MDNKTILLSEFVKKYKDATDAGKVKLLKGIIKTDYCPVVTKKIMLQEALNKSVVAKDNIVYIDSFVSKINFSITLMLLYTTIEFDKKEDGKVDTFGSYDILTKNGILDAVCAVIGEHELNEIGSVNSSIMDNFYTENTSTQAVLIRQIKTIISSIVGVVDLLSSEEVQNKLSELENL